MAAAPAVAAPVAEQQQLITPPKAPKEDSKPTLASIQNPAPSADERSKALPRPLSESEKGQQETAAPTESKVREIPLADSGEERDVVDHAAELIINSQLGSVPMLQRKLRVELKEAERVMNALEERGIVGPAQGVRAREVLVKPEIDETTAGATPVKAEKATPRKKAKKPDAEAKPVTRTAPSDTTEELDLTDEPVDLTDPAGLVADHHADGLADHEEITLELDGEDVAGQDDLLLDDSDEDDEFAVDEEFDPALAPPPGYPKHQ